MRQRFTRRRTPAIYSLLVELWNDQKPVDVITVTQILRDRKQLENVGGAAYLTSLITSTPTAANAGYYLDILEEKRTLRGIITASEAAVAAAYSDGGGAGELLDSAISNLEAVKATGQRDVASQVPIKQLVVQELEAIEQLYERRGALSGIATGFRDLDAITGGLQNTDLIVLAGRPSHGKTALAMDIARHAALKSGLSVGVFSLEMSGGQLVRRALCSLAGVNLRKLRDGFLSERDFPNLVSAAAKLADSHIHIDSAAGLTIQALRARARRMHREHGIRLLMIDQATQMRSSTKRASESRQQEVAEVTSGVKALAKELNIPIILVAHMNRQIEARPRARPRLSDLRESGSLEQDADLVMFIYRPELLCEDEEAKAELTGQAELIVAKQRNGELGDVKLTFLKEYTRFEERAETRN